jgi:hypothetical protein
MNEKNFFRGFGVSPSLSHLITHWELSVLTTFSDILAYRYFFSKKDSWDGQVFTKL